MSEQTNELPEVDAEAFEPQNYNRSFAQQQDGNTTSPLHASMQNRTAEADANLLVKFFYKMKQKGNDVNGAPLFEETEYVDIRVPGKHDPIIRPARHDDKTRFPLHYKAFKDRVDAPQEGYALTEWSGMPRTMCETLAFYNIKTVEHLAGASDGYLANIKGATRFKMAAVDFLERLTGEGKSTKVAQELDNAHKTITAQQAQIDELNAKMNKLISGQKLSVVDDDNHVSEVSASQDNTDDTETKPVVVETPKPARRRKVKK